MIPSLLSILSIIVTLGTASSVMLHDTRLDKVTAMALATPIAYANYENVKSLSSSEAHTHVERGTFSQVMNVYHTTAPGIQPRHERKHLLQKHVVRGHHAFDNYNLPIV
jgi:hypothetical protein